MHRLAAAFALFLGACTPEAPGSEATGPLRSSVAQQQEREVFGEYTVALVDGAPPVINIDGYEPMITIGLNRIHFQSQCIYADWTYQRDGETLSTEPFYKPGSAMCARALAPGETAIQDALSSPETIRHIRGGLYVEGGGHRLQLQRKMPSRAPTQILRR